jgi:DNA polymerase III epsilon subunit-like protein
MSAEKYIFLDVETTGLSSYDRVVSLGIVTIEKPNFNTIDILSKNDYLIFDPRRDNSSGAKRKHGFDDWTLRHQPLFQDHALEIYEKFEEATYIFAHNAAFDARFLKKEFEKCGLSFDDDRVRCTMLAYKRFHSGPANLDHICSQFGLMPRNEPHNALIDAYRCMLVYLWLLGFKFPDISVPETIAGMQPRNLQPVPPHPGEPLPRRTPKRRTKLKLDFEPASAGSRIDTSKNASKGFPANPVKFKWPEPKPQTPAKAQNFRPQNFNWPEISSKLDPLKPALPPPKKSVAQKFFSFIRRMCGIN